MSVYLLLLGILDSVRKLVQGISHLVCSNRGGRVVKQLCSVSEFCETESIQVQAGVQMQIGTLHASGQRLGLPAHHQCCLDSGETQGF